MDSSPEIRRRKLIDTLQCTVCADMFQNARFLPCGHSFCQSCIERCQSMIGMNCPLCRREFSLSSPGRLSELPRNFVVEDMTDVVRSLTENENIEDGIENTFNQARISGDEPKPGYSISSRTWCYLGIIVFFTLLVVFRVAGSNEEQKKDWKWQIASFFQQIFGKLLGTKKEETLLERLNKYFQQIFKSVWG